MKGKHELCEPVSFSKPSLIMIGEGGGGSPQPPFLLLVASW
jgi:hypothetical protein